MPGKRPGAADWLLFFVCVAFWGSAFAMVRVGLHDGATPWQIVAGRLLLATVFLNVFLAMRRGRGLEPPPTPNKQGKLLLLGLFGGAAPFALFAYAQLGATSGVVGLYNALSPLLVAASIPLVAPQEHKPTTSVFLGLLLGFAGVAVLMGPAALGDVAHASIATQAAATAAAVCYAINTLIARGMHVPPLEAAAGWTAWGALLSAPFAIWDTINGATPGLAAWLAILGLALGPTGIASIAFFQLVRTAGPVFMSQTNYLLPLWALALGAVAFGETISPNAVIAFALIVLGLFVAQEGWRYLRSALPG